MNIFARTNEVVAKYSLKKVVEDWNVTPGDGHLYFTFRPPWVASRVTDTFYALHPEQRVFQDAKYKRADAAAAVPKLGTKPGFGSSGAGSSIGGTAASLLASVGAASGGGATGGVARPLMA